MVTKWAKMGSPEQPAREFARQVLTERMAVVESLLPLAAHHYREDVEYDHQLRVGCRRASAALRAFVRVANVVLVAITEVIEPACTASVPRSLICGSSPTASRANAAGVNAVMEISSAA